MANNRHIDDLMSRILLQSERLGEARKNIKVGLCAHNVNKVSVLPT